MIAAPVSGTYNPYYETYIRLIAGRDPMRLLEALVIDLKALLSEVPEEKEEYRYAEGKWSVKEVIGHIVDTERIMATRALCIARGETQPLPGFDENAYVAVANFDRRTLLDIGHEFGFVRESSISLFKSLSYEDLDRAGTANGKPVTARALLYVIVGHHLHHVNVLRERYLSELD